MSRQWDKALDALTDLKHCYENRQGQEYLASFLVDYGAKREMTQEQLRSFSTPLAHSPAYADPMWVSEDIVELVEVASETFRPEAVYLDDLIVPVGFALFERPLVTTDSKGMRTAWRAVQWCTTMMQDPKDPAGENLREGLMVALYSHADDEDDYSARGPRMVIGGSLLSLMHFFPIEFGREPQPDVTDSNGDQGAVTRRVQVLWRLAQQEIVTPGQERASRPAIKRAAKYREIKTVTVLRLRRTRRPGHPEEGDGSGREYDHRWLVRGHWRNQCYETLKDHRQIWIAPHVKGPDDKPFVPKARAIDFSR